MFRQASTGANSTPSGNTSIRKTKVKVLYLTEKLEDVFLLGPGTPDIEKRRALSEAVLDQPEDPEVWLRLLRHVKEVFVRSQAHG